MNYYFMSPPSSTWHLQGRANFRSQQAEAVDPQKARAEWFDLAQNIEALGGKVIMLPSPDPSLTGMPYAAEAGHVLQRAPGMKPVWLAPRMWAPHRKAEAQHWLALARKLGIDVVEFSEGFWEAQGDVAYFKDWTFLFWGGRSNAEGLKAVRPWFRGKVLELQIREPAFHGNMALLPLPALDKIIVCPEVFEPSSYAQLEQNIGKEHFIPVSEQDIRHYATNGLPIGKSLLAPHLLPKTIQQQLLDLGALVKILEMKELCEKAGGASRCLVCVAEIEDYPLIVPPENELSAFEV